MFLHSPTGRLELPASLQAQLSGYRRRVWAVKLTEAGCGAAFGVLAAYLITFLLDRVWDTPADVRLAVFAAAAVGCGLVPLAVYRWVWRRRRADQLARLLTRTHPRVGDQLLGVIELVDNEAEQARSPALCEAAVRQVAERTRTHDFAASVPNPKHRRRAALAAGSLAVGVALLAVYPAAASNAWARFLRPWGDTPRYTFAQVETLPDHLVVAHGEPFGLPVTLTDGTAARPPRAEGRVASQPPVAAALADNRYPLEFPPQIEPAALNLRVGDFTKRVRLEPTLRPELTAVEAELVLPDYLGRPGAFKRDARGGSVTAVNGSRTVLVATATRELAAATVDGQPVSPTGATLTGPTAVVDGTRKVELRWEDRHGLGGKEPFVLTINGRADEAPSVACDGLPSRKVVLDTEHLTFKVTARDDFGVKRVGVEWKGADPTNFKNPAKGEKYLAAGGPDQELVELTGTFSAKAAGIEPQPVHVRVFAEDYLPGRPRAYSPAFLLYVLNADQHAVWITEQLSKWHRLSLDVRDKELQLFETNKQLRELPAAELDRPDTRRKVEAQADAERANGRRLTSLVESGEELVKQAMRNPEFGVGHLEKWAAMLQILKDISANRMPTVADLLKQAAQAPGAKAGKAGPTAGQMRSVTPGKGGEGDKKAGPDKPPVPAITDIESNHQPADKNAKPSPPGGPKPPAPLTLPTTLIPGGKSSDAPPPPPAAQKVDEAVRNQEALLAEFDKVVDELNKVLANLEGSTLVKRLKAASRVETRVANRLGDQVGEAFGRPDKGNAGLVKELAGVQEKTGQDVSDVMDDMQAYFERRRFVKIKAVLDEMQKADVLGGLRQLADDLPKEGGLSMAQCEFWADTLDRWADDLVDPSACGSCPGGKSKDSLPPSIVLEVLQILEAEVNLREDTRVAERAKAAAGAADHAKQAKALSAAQDKLRDRVDKVIPRIQELPDGEAQFAKELALLGRVSEVMSEATDILAKPDTGNPAIAAETEAIELLLQSKRFKPGGGGGGGSTPGGGGGGTTTDSALSLIGRGVNEKEVRQSPRTAMATGETGAALPEEFRAGLDAYFNRLAKEPAGR